MAKGSFGERLKREREMREVSLDELTKSTRIPRRFLEALENEDWNKLPGGVFGRGFVRTVALYLGLDEEVLLGEYDLARGVLPRSGPAKPEDRIPATPLWIPIVAVLAIGLILAGLVFGGRYFWRKYAERRHSGPSSALVLPPADPSAESSTVAAAGGAQPANASLLDAKNDPNAPANSNSQPAPVPPAASLDLSVSTSAATRVRVLADDKLVLDEELPGGVNRHLSAADHFEITAADSSAVLLELNHQVMRPLGPPGASGTMVLSKNDLRTATSGDTQPGSN
jgi:cytoskeleton protein RodZ